MNADLYLEDLKSKFNKINPCEYYLAYSGGRDSHFVFWFIKEFLKVDIKVVSVNTLMEHPEIRHRMYENADLVLIPTKKHDEIKEKYGIPCFSKHQDEHIRRFQSGTKAKSTLDIIYGNNKSKFSLSAKARKVLLSGKLHKVSPYCCKFLKKEPLLLFEKKSGLMPIICLRSSEGIMRNKIKSCFHKNGSFTPIYDLTDDLLREIEEKYSIPIPFVYNTLDRTGCMGCPYGRDIQKELSTLSKAQRKFISSYFKESYQVKNIQKNNLIDFME